MSALQAEDEDLYHAILCDDHTCIGRVTFFHGLHDVEACNGFSQYGPYAHGIKVHAFKVFPLD